MELGIFHLYQQSDGSHQLLCQIFSTQFGLPYGLLLAGLTLASCERYLALARQQFYQNYATTKNAIRALVFTVLLVTGVVLSPYWTGIYTVECGLRYTWMVCTFVFHGLMSSTCLAVQTRLFLFIRSCLRYAPAVENIQLQHIRRRRTSLNGDEHQTNDNMNRNRLEIHAARVLGFGILPFCLVHLTLCICGVIGTILKSQGFNTSMLRMVMMMCRELIRLHLIYIPVVFMTQSREFRAAFKRFCRFRKSKKAENFN